MKSWSILRSRPDCDKPIYIGNVDAETGDEALAKYLKSRKRLSAQERQQYYTKPSQAVKVNGGLLPYLGLGSF